MNTRFMPTWFFSFCREFDYVVDLGGSDGGLIFLKQKKNTWESQSRDLDFREIDRMSIISV